MKLPEHWNMPELRAAAEKFFEETGALNDDNFEEEIDLKTLIDTYWES
jgi:hypothetical protein